MTIDTMSGRVRRLTGWRRPLVAFLLGAVSALAQAPFGLLPVLLLAFPGFVWLLEGCRAAPRPLRAGFWTGWAFGFGACAVGLYWIAFAFLVQAEAFAWMIPIIVPGLMAFLALYAGLSGWLALLVWRVGPWGGTPLFRVLSLAGAWSLGEVLRGHLLTGFPWNIVSQSATAWLPLAQGAAWLGPYGLSLVMVALACLPAAARGWRHGLWRGLWPWLALGGALTVTVLVNLDVIAGRKPAQIGSEASLEASSEAGPEAQLVIVQPNVPQRDKLDPDKRDANLLRTLQMTARAARAVADAPAAYAIWPENAYPYLSEQAGIGAGLAAVLPANTILITGSVRAWRDEEDYRFGNAVQVFGTSRGGEKPLEAVYDKHHLVPFGEFLPLSGLFEALGLASMSPVGAGGFTPGPGPSVLPIGPAAFAPLVCYEDVFPGQLYPADRRPRWLVVVTNDAWFGDGAGPEQHLAIAQMRAIESGLPLARSANTGISALIDPRGRILGSVPLYEEGVLTAPLPPAGGRTIYERAGEATWVVLLLSVVLLPFFTGLARKG